MLEYMLGALVQAQTASSDTPPKPSGGVDLLDLDFRVDRADPSPHVPPTLLK